MSKVLQLATERALVLAAHTDDEFGCAGAVLRLIQSGIRVQYIAVSRCEESVPAGLPPNILEEECRRCTARLGLASDDVHVWHYPVRRFPEFRQAILEEFVRVSRSFVPELVLLPSSDDTHQDHRTIYEEGFRAFKRSTLLGYELPQNLISFSNSAFVTLSPEQLELKIAALGEYRSQAFRDYASGEFIRSLAQVRGVQAGAQYAEAYEAIRLIIR